MTYYFAQALKCFYVQFKLSNYFRTIYSNMISYIFLHNFLQYSYTISSNIPTQFPSIFLHNFIQFSYTTSYNIPTQLPAMFLHNFLQYSYTISYNIPIQFPTLILYKFLQYSYTISYYIATQFPTIFPHTLFGSYSPLNLCISPAFPALFLSCYWRGLYRELGRRNSWPCRRHFRQYPLQRPILPVQAEDSSETRTPGKITGKK